MTRGRGRGSLRQALAAEAKRLAARLQRRERGDVRIEGLAVRGRPFDGILRHAERRGAELVVVGRHGGGGLRTLLIGSTAERVARGRVTSVLVVTGAARRPYRRPLVAVDAVTRFVAIVEETMRLLPADLPGIDVVSAYEVLYEGYVRTRGWSPTEVRKLRAKLGAEARQSVRSQLAKRIPEATRLGLLVKRGEPRRVIRSVVEQRRPDLVALGTASRRGLARFLLGSVAADILRSSEVDVLVVPYPERLKARASP
jgi:nucleotide-binding universal stress UspA family protein